MPTYILQSALLLAGLDGIKKKIQPPDPVDVNTYKLSDKEMKKMSLKKLPTSLKESSDALSSDNVFLKPVFDDDFIDMYIRNLEKIK